MIKIQKIRCSNCGSFAERQHFPHHEITQTACPVCDYFMSNCSRTGRVLEFYASLGRTASCR